MKVWVKLFLPTLSVKLFRFFVLGQSALDINCLYI